MTWLRVPAELHSILQFDPAADGHDRLQDVVYGSDDMTSEFFKFSLLELCKQCGRHPQCCVARPMSRLVAAEMARSACAEVVPFCVLWVRGPERSGTHARYRAIGDSS